jgi:hypothetical protein
MPRIAQVTIGPQRQLRPGSLSPRTAAETAAARPGPARFGVAENRRRVAEVLTKPLLERISAAVIVEIASRQPEPRPGLFSPRFLHSNLPNSACCASCRNQMKPQFHLVLAQ